MKTGQLGVGLLLGLAVVLASGIPGIERRRLTEAQSSASILGCGVSSRFLSVGEI